MFYISNYHTIVTLEVSKKQINSAQGIISYRKLLTPQSLIILINERCLR
jgi:hypothetical protein